MEQPTPRDEHRIAVVGVLDAHRHVRLELLHQPIADVAPRQVFGTRTTREWRLVHTHSDRHRGLLDLDGLEWHRVGQVDDRVTDVEVGHAREDDNLARGGALNRHAASRLKVEELGDLDLANLRARARREADGRVLDQLARGDASDAQPPDERVRADVRDLELERLVVRHLGFRERHDLVEEGRHVRADRIRFVASDLVDRRRVHHREVGLLVRRAQLAEEVEGLVEHVVRARSRLVDLVNDDKHLVAHGKRLFEHEARLRFRALRRIHKQQHGVHHAEHTLHLAAKVGVARSVDDVDLDAIPCERRILCKNGNATFTLLSVAVQKRIVSLDVRRFEHRIHKRGLAVVDVSDNRNVAQIGTSGLRDGIHMKHTAPCGDARPATQWEGARHRQGERVHGQACHHCGDGVSATGRAEACVTSS